MRKYFFSKNLDAGDSNRELFVLWTFTAILSKPKQKIILPVTMTKMALQQSFSKIKAYIKECTFSPRTFLDLKFGNVIFLSRKNFCRQEKISLQFHWCFSLDIFDSYVKYFSSISNPIFRFWEELRWSSPSKSCKPNLLFHSFNFLWLCQNVMQHVAFFPPPIAIMSFPLYCYYYYYHYHDIFSSSFQLYVIS